MPATLDSLEADIAALKTLLETVSYKVDDIHAEAMGSWEWDKSTGRLTLYTATGSLAAIFDVADLADSAIRTRRQDLEVV